jgi:hypothetical protein
MATESWRGPLSGDVTQAINPWTWWIRGSQQAGFININTSRTDDPDLERRIVENVASYGRQLGRLVEAVQVLVTHLPGRADLSVQERAAIEAFTGMAEQIAAVKGAGSGTPTVAKVDRFLADLDALRTTDPQRYRELADRVRAGLPDGGPDDSLGA